MGENKKVKDIMVPLENYRKVSMDASLCDALTILKRMHEEKKLDAVGRFHETLFVIDGSGKIVGKLSPYDLVRGLVPGHAKEPELSRAYSSMISSRVMEVDEEVGEVQERFRWLHASFADLVKQESQKKVKEVMSPVHPILKEDSAVNEAVYVMFKENIRQPLVVRGTEVVGVVDLHHVFTELLEMIGPECGVVV